jgi:hypothetical protein
MEVEWVGFMITFVQQGDFKRTTSFLERCKDIVGVGILNKYGKQGVQALSKATPVLTGKTADSWTYEIKRSSGSAAIVWSNTNVNNGVNIAVILQYGHGTKNGGYVRGVDYINPAMKPIFDKIAEEAWKEVTK